MSTLEDNYRRSCAELAKTKEALNTANALLEKAYWVIKKHHGWHLDFTDVPKEFVGMNMAAEYAESTMCDETEALIKEIEQHGEGK